ncbi:hypothetical protein [Halobacterium yunchengense]|uniref:hypothetical protein n=1 Tax=Halobacterium yunchengense TaxID=3108497 RepID=UPI00300853B5
MSESVFSSNELTFREWHAAVLGACVGAVAAYARTADYAVLAGAVAALFVLASLGVARYGSVAGRTVRKEPWYALAAFVAAGGVVLVAVP